MRSQRSCRKEDDSSGTEESPSRLGRKPAKVKYTQNKLNRKQYRDIAKNAQHYGQNTTVEEDDEGNSEEEEVKEEELGNKDTREEESVSNEDTKSPEVEPTRVKRIGVHASIQRPISKTKKMVQFEEDR